MLSARNPTASDAAIAVPARAVPGPRERARDQDGDRDHRPHQISRSEIVPRLTQRAADRNQHAGTPATDSTIDMRRMRSCSAAPSPAASARGRSRIRHAPSPTPASQNEPDEQLDAVPQRKRSSSPSGSTGGIASRRWESGHLPIHCVPLPRPARRSAATARGRRASAPRPAISAAPPCRSLHQ